MIGTNGVATSNFSFWNDPERADDCTPVSRNRLERALLEDKLGIVYRPNLPVQFFTGYDHNLPPLWRFYFDLPAMLKHQRVEQAMSFWKGGVSDAEFEIEASSPAVRTFVATEIDRFWESLDQIQQGDDWGWCGCQVYYTIEQGLMHTVELEAFAGRDVKALIDDCNNYIGFRVNNNDGNPCHLWGPQHGPAKGFWYVHRPMRGLLYGWAQPFAAWRPWRRLAQRDGAEECLDGGMYRFAYGGTKIRYPDEDVRATRSSSPGQRVSNKSKADEAGSMFKAGAVVTLPSKMRDGVPEWDLEQVNVHVDTAGLITHQEHLGKEIDRGCGVPSEMIQAGESGGGYRGREIPLEGYYQTQKNIAKSKVKQWKKQIGDPLVKWNFGPHAWFRIKVKSLMASRAKANAGIEAPSPMVQNNGLQPLGSTEPRSPGEIRSIGPREPRPLEMAAPGELEPAAVPAVPTVLPENIEIDFIAREAAAAFERLGLLARAEVIRALTAGGSTQQILDRVRPILEKHKINYAKLLTASRLAAVFAAMNRVAPSELVTVAETGSADYADTLVADALEPLPLADREKSLGALDEERRGRIEAILKTRAIDETKPADEFWTVEDGEGEPIEFAVINAAVRDLRSKKAVTREQFDRMTSEQRAEAFTVAGIHEENTIEQIQTILADVDAAGLGARAFKRRVEAELGDSPFLSPAHANTVFRTNTISGYARGQDEILADPMVIDLFPYRAIWPTHDVRTRPWHRATETAGLDGTNVYNASDPTWKVIRSPSDYNCRCLSTPYTVEQAAAAGVREAQEWMRTGQPPERPTFVPLPPGWQQSPDFVRMSADLIEGGKSDDMPESDFPTELLDEGQRVELEHTDDPAVAREIAKDHLAEDLDYYKKLAAMESKPKRKFSSTQFDLPEPLAGLIRTVGEMVPDNELADKGREQKPHVTVKYGLHTDDAGELKAIAKQFGPVELKLGKLAVFPPSENGEQYDVLIVEVLSPDLFKLNEAIAGAIDHTDTHPVYRPHATVAYLKPGEGAKYDGLDLLEGQSAVCDCLAFSDRERYRMLIELRSE